MIAVSGFLFYARVGVRVWFRGARGGFGKKRARVRVQLARAVLKRGGVGEKRARGVFKRAE